MARPPARLRQEAPDPTVRGFLPPRAALTSHHMRCRVVTMETTRRAPGRALTRDETKTARGLSRRFTEARERQAAVKAATLQLLAGLEDVSEVALSDELGIDRMTVRAWLGASARAHGVPPRPPRPGQHGRELNEDELPAVRKAARKIRDARRWRGTVKAEILTFLGAVDGAEEKALATLLGVDLPRTLRPWMALAKAASSETVDADGS